MMKETNKRKRLEDAELEQVVGGSGGGAVASGSFASDSGTQLNLLVSWSAFDIGGGQRKLEVTVSTTSYSLFANSMENGVELTVNGALYLGNSAAVSYSGSAAATTPLAAFSVTVPAGTVTMNAVWHFRGSYSGKPLENITAAGIATV